MPRVRITVVGAGLDPDPADVAGDERLVSPGDSVAPADSVIRLLADLPKPYGRPGDEGRRRVRIPHLAALVLWVRQALAAAFGSDPIRKIAL